jgi:hypothetical protein
MSEALYFAGADATLKAGAVSIGAVSGWSFEITWQRNDKYSSESIFLRAAAKYQMEISVKMKIASFDPTVGGEGAWWLFKSLAGGGATNVDKNGDAITIGHIGDTSAVSLFDIVGEVAPFNTGGAKVMVTAEDCYVTGFPFEVKENEWVYMEITADAADVVYTNPV